MMRMDSFLSFHKRFVVEDDLVGPMNAYFRIARYTEEEIWKFLCLYATCYSIPTSILFMNCGDIRSFCQENKSRLIFQSDRRWMRIGDRFVRGFASVHNPQLFKFLHIKKWLTYERALTAYANVPFSGVSLRISYSKHLWECLGKTVFSAESSISGKGIPLQAAC